MFFSQKTNTMYVQIAKKRTKRSKNTITSFQYVGFVWDF